MGQPVLELEVGGEWIQHAKYRRRWRSDGIVETMIDSPLGDSDTCFCIEELADFVGDDGVLRELVINESGCVIDERYDRMQTAVTTAERVLGGMTSVMIAFVAPQDLPYALCRQLAMRINAPTVKISVFRGRFEAERWLAGEG